MIDRSRYRLIALFLAASVVAVAGWFVHGAVSERQLRTQLAAAASDMEAGNFARSRDRLLRLAERYRGRDDILFRLGESELACGRLDRAAIAWSQVPKGSPRAAAAAVRRAQLALPAGQFAEAETILRGALDESGPESGGVRHLLLSILGQQGRLGEARALIEARWRATAPDQRDERVALLHEHLALDLETFPLEGNLAFLQAGKAPGTGDARLWLAQANLATKSGNLEDGRRWLDAALLREPNDPVLWQARLDWALAAGRLDRVKEGSLIWRSGARCRASGAAGGLASRAQGDKQTERIALEKLVEHEPGDEEAIDRLAELAFQAGRQEDGRRFRQRKSKLDRVKDQYRQLFRGNQFVENAAEMALCPGAGSNLRGRRLPQLGRGRGFP